MTETKASCWKKLSRRKTYPNTGQGVSYPILARYLHEEGDQEGVLRPSVGIFLCRWIPATKDERKRRVAKDSRGRFEYVIFTDLLEEGTVPSDSYGFGTLKCALENFESRIIYLKTGFHKWVLEEIFKEAREIRQREARKLKISCNS